jgi:tetratricopeptide (TPR) repeat protein
MLAKKKRIIGGAIVFFAMAIFFAGCSPPGTRALLKGKKFLDRGDYADAVAEFKTATAILSTNAEAWNDLGVAEQHAGQFTDAANAYQRALELNRDLTEAHYNLGCLWLEQNKFDDAKSEFTAYTLRRANTPEGWLKLGLTQLRLHDVLSAEKSFSTALYLSPNNAEALNGLGLARVQRGRPQEAAKFFEAAVQNHPDFAPAILNLATVEREDLHDDKLALENYRAYLALTPRQPDWDDVNAIVGELEKSVPAAQPPQNQIQSAPPAPRIEARSVPPAVQPAPQNEFTQRTPPPRAAQEAPPSVRPEAVRVPPETTIAAAPNSTTQANETTPRKTTLFHWFHSAPTQEAGVTPLPPPENSSENAAPKPVHIVQPAPPVYPRYLYLSPSKPEPGDRRAAASAFAQARKFEAEKKFPDALNSYHEAARLDPSWFEAQYNCGVMAYRLRDFDLSLSAYEMALAIQPDSADARYNFALALKAAGYATDAENELKKLLTSHPDDVRAHLALGNLYAQQFFDVPRARAEYLKVLQLDPGNPQASDIQFWLSANPP